MQYVKNIIGVLLYFVIGIAKIPITLVVVLSVAIEAGFVWLLKKSVELANIHSLTESYNAVMDFNSDYTFDLSLEYDELKIDEQSED